MRKLLFFLLLITPGGAAAQVDFDVDQSVKVTASATSSPPIITVRWLEDPRTVRYELYRRRYGAASWGPRLAQFSPNVTEYLDTAVVAQQRYEYKVVKHAEGIDGYGYVLTGIQLPPVHEAGRLIIVTTPATASALTGNIDQFRQILDTDGWPSKLITVAPDARASEVHAAITEEHTDFGATAVLLLGEVPLALSGNINPDAHPEHRGAWPADLYYGDVDGVWTDTSVNTTTADATINHNVPGDGKWDQSFLPSDVELAVGRVDFSRLTVFPQSHADLLRGYLNKNIAFRTGALTVAQRAAMRNSNPWTGALGQNGIRNFSPLVGPENITYGVWQSVFSDDYLWYYGAGSDAVNNGLTGKFQRESFRAVFTLWFSSYVGDYALPDSYMAATLGSGNVLTAGWAGAPHWHLHSMAMGYPIGHGLTTTQNNDTIYTAGFFPRGTHVNLLGDPSLKSVITPPPTSLTLTQNSGSIDLDWTAPISPPSRYYLYRRVGGSTSFGLIDSVSASITSYTDAEVSPGTSYDYLVRAAELTTTPSGTFWNLSAGSAGTITLTTSADRPPRAVSIKVFPNPASSELFITTDREAGTIVLYSPNGVILRKKNTTSAVTSLDITGLPSGPYLLRYIRPGGATGARVIAVSR